VVDRYTVWGRLLEKNVAAATKKSSVLKQATERATKDLVGYEGAADLFSKFRDQFNRSLSLDLQLKFIGKPKHQIVRSARKAKK
jgi:hypothetical protein